jgi:hypothetical protein
MMQPGGARVRCCRLNSTNTGHRKSFQLTRKDSMPRVGVNRAAFVTRTDPFPAVSSRRPTCRSLPGRRSPVRQNGRVTLLTRCYTTFFQRCKALPPNDLRRKNGHEGGYGGRKPEGNRRSRRGFHQDGVQRGQPQPVGSPGNSCAGAAGHRRARPPPEHVGAPAAERPFRPDSARGPGDQPAVLRRARRADRGAGECTRVQVGGHRNVRGRGISDCPGVRGGAAGRMLWTYRNALSQCENPQHSGR